mmetsp:Transcript_11896/g.25545  ORF Transcript_11896/g.25545 Transcript_11896/m.25545 type:complete len:829 (-) Transcript_11896:1416-3902(-)
MDRFILGDPRFFATHPLLAKLPPFQGLPLGLNGVNSQFALAFPAPMHVAEQQAQVEPAQRPLEDVLTAPIPRKRRTGRLRPRKDMQNGLWFLHLGQDDTSISGDSHSGEPSGSHRSDASDVSGPKDEEEQMVAEALFDLANMAGKEASDNDDDDDDGDDDNGQARRSSRRVRRRRFPDEEDMDYEYGRDYEEDSDMAKRARTRGGRSNPTTAYDRHASQRASASARDQRVGPRGQTAPADSSRMGPRRSPHGHSSFAPQSTSGSKPPGRPTEQLYRPSPVKPESNTVGDDAHGGHAAQRQSPRSGEQDVHQQRQQQSPAAAAAHGAGGSALHRNQQFASNQRTGGISPVGPGHMHGPSSQLPPGMAGWMPHPNMPGMPAVFPPNMPGMMAVIKGPDGSTILPGGAAAPGSSHAAFAAFGSGFTAPPTLGARRDTGTVEASSAGSLYVAGSADGQRPKVKRCAMHVYIAHFIMQEQSARGAAAKGAGRAAAFASAVTAHGEALGQVGHDHAPVSRPAACEQQEAYRRESVAGEPAGVPHTEGTSEGHSDGSGTQLHRSGSGGPAAAGRSQGMGSREAGASGSAAPAAASASSTPPGLVIGMTGSLDPAAYPAARAVHAAPTSTPLPPGGPVAVKQEGIPKAGAAAPPVQAKPMGPAVLAAPVPPKPGAPGPHGMPFVLPAQLVVAAPGMAPGATSPAGTGQAPPGMPAVIPISMAPRPGMPANAPGMPQQAFTQFMMGAPPGPFGFPFSALPFAGHGILPAALVSAAHGLFGSPPGVGPGVPVGGFVPPQFAMQAAAGGHPPMAKPPDGMMPAAHGDGGDALRRPSTGK